MSNRYLLTRTDKSKGPFDSEVGDKYQNSEIQSVENLSEGEKFLVSLSLALGIANIAGKNIRIDSMFIEKGFGTLNVDYLDVALYALAKLISEREINCSISHLTELKERILIHLELRPTSNGRTIVRIVE